MSKRARQQKHIRALQVMARAAHEYRRAIKAVLDKDVEPQTRLDLTVGDAALWFSIPIASEIRRDRVRRKAFENSIHDAVSDVDPKLVGLAALLYQNDLVES